MNTTLTAPRAALLPDPVDDAVFVLGLVYLELGLAPEDAFRAALADYDCSGEWSVA